MKCRIIACCCILWILAVLPCAHNCQAGSDPEEQINIKSSVESEYGRASAEGIIHAGPEMVWQVLTDYEHLSEYMPDVKSCRVIGKTGNTLRLQYEIGISIFSSSYTAELTEEEEKGLQKWHVVAGDFNVNSGSWRLIPLDGNRTRLLYEVKLSHKLFPDFLIIKLLTRRLPEVYEAIRQRAEAQDSQEK